MRLIKSFCFLLLMTSFALSALEDRSSWSIADHISYLNRHKDDIIAKTKLMPGKHGKLTFNLALSADLQKPSDDDEWDGSFGTDIGLGSPDRFVMASVSIVATSIGLFKDGKIGDRGFINFGLTRNITDKTVLELYFNQAIPWGNHQNERKGYSFSVSHTFSLPGTSWMPDATPLKIAAGTGTGGGFESYGSILRGEEDNSFHPAGSVTLYFIERTSAAVTWTGRQLNSSIMVQPFLKWPMHVRVSANDITKNSNKNKVLLGLDLYYSIPF